MVHVTLLQTHAKTEKNIKTLVKVKEIDITGFLLDLEILVDSKQLLEN